MERDPRYKIFQYEIPGEALKANFELELPLYANILTFQAQGTRLYIWAMVNTKEEITEKRYFRLAVTGRNLDFYRSVLNANYIGTAQMANALIFHLFEIYTGEN